MDIVSQQPDKDRERTCRYRPQTSGRRSGRCTNPDVSCCRTLTTSAARGRCRIWASRRSPPPAPALRGRSGVRQSRHPGGRVAASHRALRRGRSACQRRFRGRLCPQAGEGRGSRRAGGQDRRGRVVDRGFHRRCGQAALRARVRDRAHQGGALGDRRRWERRSFDRPLRGFSGRAGRSQAGDRPVDRLCRGGRGLSLCAGHQDQGARSRRS